MATRKKLTYTHKIITFIQNMQINFNLRQNCLIIQNAIICDQWLLEGINKKIGG